MNIQRRERESGQVLVILALGIVVLLGFAALAIDQGSVQIDRRQAQSAADQAALAGALAKYEDGNCEAIAINRAGSNGYSDSDEVDVQINCEYGEEGEYVQVIISTTTSTFLASFLGQSTVTNTVEAVALYSSGGSRYADTFNGNAIISLAPDGNDTFEVSGNANLVTQGGGAFVNSTSERAFFSNGDLVFGTDTGINVVGGARVQGNATLNSDLNTGGDVNIIGQPDINGAVMEGAAVTPIPFPVPALEIDPPVVVVPECAGSGTMSSEGGVVRLTPGFHPTRSISGSADVVFEPGNYCFGGNLTINGNFTVTANNVQFIMDGSDMISLNGDLTFNAANTLFYLESGLFQLDGNATLDIPNSIIYMVSGDLRVNGNMNPKIISDQTTIVYLGSGRVHFNGNSTFTTFNTIFYLNSGDLKWNGNTKLVMNPPEDGIYAGLLLYAPVTNTSTIRINGNSNAALTGTIAAPGANVELIGNSGTTAYHSQVIGYTVDISGVSDTTIIYNNDENYNFGNSAVPFIELTK